MKRTLSILLAVMMLFAALPMTALAAVSDTAATGAAYDLWVGSTQVTDANKDDILDDGGSAQFDPATNTLTLDDPEITELYKGSFIYSTGIDLTVKGNWNMTTDDCEEGLWVELGTLTLDGKFSFKGKFYGFRCLNDVTVAGGNLYAEGVDYGLYWAKTLTVADGVERVEFKGGKSAVYADTFGVDLTKFMLSTPEGGSVASRQIYNADGTAAKHAVFEPLATNIWIGDTRITAENKDDVLNDGGKVKFEPATRTLTLDNPSVIGEHENSGIYSGGDLTLRGSGSVRGNSFGLNVQGNLTIDGDFTFTGKSSAGVATKGDIDILTGTLQASGTYNGISCGRKMFVRNEVTKLEADGDIGALYAKNGLYPGDELTITEPVGGWYVQPSVREEDGDTLATHVVIQPASAQPVVIDRVTIAVELPEKGKTPQINLNIPEDAEYTLDTEQDSIAGSSNGVLWNYMDAQSTTGTNAGVLSPNDSFETGKLYNCTVYLKANSGCCFDSTTVFYINDESAAILTLNGEKCSIRSKEMPCKDSGSEDPDGSYFVVTGDSGWLDGWDPNPDDNLMSLYGDGTYKITISEVPATPEGKNYSLKVVEFPDGGDGEAIWHGLDGGSLNVDFRVVAEGDVTVSYNPETGEITVTGPTVTDPVYPISYITAVGKTDNESFLNGISWNPDAEENRMTEVSEGVYEITYCSVAAGTYQVKFAANGGWDVNWGLGSTGSDSNPTELNTETEAAYNGGNAEFVLTDACDVTLRLDLSGMDWNKKTGSVFTVTAVPAGSSDVIRSVGITIAAPVGGEKPSYDAAFDNDTAYAPDKKYDNNADQFNGIYWYDETADSVVHSKTAFIAGHDYHFEIMLKPNEGFTFIEEPAATVNGIPAVDTYYNGETLFITSAAMTAEAPVSGALLGDVDRDGKVDIFDASSIQKSIAGMSGYPNYHSLDKNSVDFRIADVDKDGKVDIFDASLIQKYIAGDSTAKAYGIGQAL